MDRICRTCGKSTKAIDYSHMVKICLTCCKNIVKVLTDIDNEVNTTGEDYINRFEAMSEGKMETLNTILLAYEKCNDIAFPVQRAHAKALLDAKTERTISAGGEIGEALGAWQKHKAAGLLLSDVVYLSINIRENQDLERWVKEYAKRTSR